MNQESVRNEGSPVQKKKINDFQLTAIIVISVAFFVVGGCFILGGASIVSSAKYEAGREAEKLQSPINETQKWNFQPIVELPEMFMSEREKFRSEQEKFKRVLEQEIQRQKKEKEDVSLSAEDLIKSTASNLFPYVIGDTLLWKERFVGNIVEWTFTIKDVTRTDKGYMVSSYYGDFAANVEIIPLSDEQIKKVENFKPGNAFNFRGYAFKALEGGEFPLHIYPAVLLEDNKLIANHVDSLNAARGEVLNLDDLKKEISEYRLLTTLKKDQAKQRFESLKGKIVQGQIEDWKFERTTSGFLIKGYDSAVIEIDLHVANNTYLANLLKDPVNFVPPLVHFRGYIYHMEDEKILIGPAIFLKHAISSEQRILEEEKSRIRDKKAESEELVAQWDREDEESRRKAYEKMEMNRRQVLDDLRATEEAESTTDKMRLTKESYPPEIGKSRSAVFNPDPQAMPGERYPQTRLQLLGPPELIDLNLNDLRYAINEMYARHGAVFKNAELAKSFADKEWYKPRPEVSFKDIEAQFSEIEADNLRLLGKERDRKTTSADLYELIDSESNLRDGPGTNYPIVRKSRKGEVGQSLSIEKGWVKLQFMDGSMAWAHEQNLRAAK